MKKATKQWLIAGGVAAGLLLWAGMDTRLNLVSYTVPSEAVTAPVRLVLLTDLHACDYGAGQRELLDLVQEQQPDVVLLSGDIVDDSPDMPIERALDTVESLAAQWPAYYVTGNHEFRTGQADEIKAEMTQNGAVVLDGTCMTVNVKGQTLQIGGVDDPSVGEKQWEAQLNMVSDALQEDSYSILLSHRPERVKEYTGRGFDLVVAGHAHGGQWRLPGIINGLIAPNQGLFPQYAGGMYDLDGTALIVSRGLARESTSIPRLFNPPEVVVVDVVPGMQKNN